MGSNSNGLCRNLLQIWGKQKSPLNGVIFGRILQRLLEEYTMITFWRILQPLGRNYSRGIQPIHLWTPGSSARPAYHFDTIYIHQMSNSNTNAREGLAAGWSLRDFIPFEEFSIGFLLSTDRSVALVASETTWLINHLSHLLRHLRQPSPSGT